MARDELQGYVSVNLRLALMRADHPEADVTYEVVDAEHSGIHEAFRGDTKWFVTCTITAPGMTPITTWKEVPKTVVRWQNGQRKNVPAELNPEFLVKLQTMAAGRALKMMGYPDAIVDLKPLLLWRRRTKELELLAAAGQSMPQLGQGDDDVDEPMAKALAGAAVLDGDDERPDDDEVAEAEVVEEAPPVEDAELNDARTEWRVAFEAAAPAVRNVLVDKARAVGIRSVGEPRTVGECETLSDLLWQAEADLASTVNG